MAGFSRKNVLKISLFLFNLPTPLLQLLYLNIYLNVSKRHFYRR
jgi:hypothetical protein